MSTEPLPDSVLSPEDAAQVASLDEVRTLLVAEARSWAARLQHCQMLALRAEQAGAQVRRTLALELAGSWQIGQLTAERWLAEADRFHDALPQTLALLASGDMLRHQAEVLLHKTQSCRPEVARAVEAEVLPAAAGLGPADLRRRVARVRLRIEREQQSAEQADRQEAERVAARRTFARATDDAMALAGAVVTPEQGMAWAAGLDALERRERLADRAAGIERTAEQRRADLFAALPALVLAGVAQDDPYRQAAGIAGGRLAATPGETLPLTDSSKCKPWTLGAERVAAQIVLNVHVPVATVLELAQQPGSLDRYGPISAAHVRLLRPKSFRRVMVDAHTGRPIAVDDRTTPADPDRAIAREQVLAMLRPAVVADVEEPQHDPSARLAGLVDLRDVHCAGPGCSSTVTDRDHLDPYPNGPTSAGNLGRLSRRCHSAKHSGWTLTRHDDGSTTWHSRLHRRYDRPSPHDPPPQVDLHAELPPVRQVARADAHDGDDIPLLDQLTLPESEPPPVDPPDKRAIGWNDDPPF